MLKQKAGKEEKSIAEELQEKTGFILEHNVATILENNNWFVIHNRFYLDDVQPIQREIDLLAYRVREYDDAVVYTTIIVSCKKSAFKDWVFLTRDAPSTKLNLDIRPYTYWSNSKIVNHLFSGKFSDMKFCDQDKLSKIDSLFEYDKTVFAFREYDNKQATNKLANDTGIYESIITLIKSQAYELESLPTRRDDKDYFYNINLLAVADVNKFIEIECSGDELVEREIENINYVNRFIVNKSEHNSRIIFTKFSAIDKVVADFNLLHDLNCEIIKKGIPNFYSQEIFESYQARAILIEDYGDELVSEIKWQVSDEVDVIDSDFRYFDFHFDNEENKIILEFSASEKLIDYLNNNQEVYEIAKNWLFCYLRYTGNFTFEINDLPF
ncbi:hypothetical protein HQN86_08525 [Pedobacter panaciterrae]|uniref:hypothetical protein n=1 Tax=Pedobacter panaciterrae TaxID=363849 RepID=UPI00155DBF4C|nr:hypothetical protein [Pedobacter panaciterrae]NQX53655.1 hypothetical protein [Pedobacter panaciterrae]